MTGTDIRRLSMLTCTIVLFSGCTLTRTSRPDGMSVRTTPDPELGMVAYTGDDVLRIAGQAFDLCEYSRSYALYMRYLAEFPGTSSEAYATFQAGLAAERAGLFTQAVSRYTRFIEITEEDRDRLTARFRLVAAGISAQRWDVADEQIDRLLSRADTSGVDRFELKVQRAWVQANTDDPAVAEHSIRNLTRRYRHDRGRTMGSYQGGMANFYLGEICRLQAEQVRVHSVDDLDAARTELEHKAEHILASQEAYLETVRIGAHHWIPRAGYSLGSLYTTFRRDILTAPFPASVATDDDRELYTEILDEETAVLLFKTRMVYEKVLSKADEICLNDEALAMIRESLVQVQMEIDVNGLAAEI
jgi:hypothetical protein